MIRRFFQFAFVLTIILILAGCDGIIPDKFGVDVNANVTTTSDLGQETLERVDAINETLNSGIEVGPETRETIDELNKTIADGIKAGFDEETLARVDELLRVVEDGLKIGLDSETLASIDNMVNTIDEMPGNWETSANDVIRTLEGSAGTAAKKMADEVKGVISEAKLNYQQMTAVTGTEFRCNVDYLGSKAGATVQEFIGKSLIGKIRNILSKKPAEEKAVPTPWVCQIIPDQVELSQVGETLVYEAGVIALTGYNFVAENTPRAVIHDENGQEVGGVNLQVYRTSPYQLQINLQNLDLSQVPARSRLVFIWPNVAETSGVAILLPAHQVPVAAFDALPTSGDAPLTVQFTDQSINDPVQWEWSFGDGATSLEQNPSHTFTEGGSFDVRLTATNSRGSTMVTKTISIGVPLAADFIFTQDSNDVPLLVTFTDKSKGSPTNWLWNFGDGSTSTDQNPSHVYTQANSNGYVVSLTVNNPSATSTKTATDHVKALTPVIAKFTADVVTGVPPLMVKFTDQSSGDIVAWNWDFGDDTTSTQRNPTHIYQDIGQKDVTLKVMRSDGETDTKVVNAMITVKDKRLLFTGIKKPIFLNTWKFPENSIFFNTYSISGSGQQLDTGIWTSKYVCAIAGYAFGPGHIYPINPGVETFGVFLWPTTTWWLTAGYMTDAAPISVNVVCFDKALEGKAILYRNDFREIASATDIDTGILASDYFSCNIAGSLARGMGSLSYTGMMFGSIQPVLLQSTMYSAGGNWRLKADIPVNITETWDINTLCLKSGSFMLGDNPPFASGSVDLISGGSHQADTGKKVADYFCAVGGYTAKYGDQGFNGLLPTGANPVLAVNMVAQNGNWWVYADHASVLRDEDWTINYWCARKPYAVQGPPPQ